MDIHKPKPVHNFREFLSEVCVVVLGIAIALSGERAIQSYEWAENIKRSEEAIREEIAGYDGPQVLQRLALAPCVDSSLSRVRQRVEQGADRETVLSEISSDHLEPLWTWDHIAFDAANSSGSLARMSPQRLTDWSNFYAVMAPLDRTNERESRDVAELRAISHSGGALSEAERMRVLEAVEALAQDNHDMVVYARVAEDAMKTLHVSIAPELRDRDIADFEKRPSAAACLEDLKKKFDDFTQGHKS